MYRYFNNFSASLAADIDDNDASVSVITDVDLSSINADNPMVGTLVQGDVTEIVDVIGVTAGDPGILILDIVRGVEGTTPAAFSTAARLECRWTAGSANRSQQGDGLPLGAIIQFETAIPPDGFEAVTMTAVFSAGDGMKGLLAETSRVKFVPDALPADIEFDVTTDGTVAANGKVYLLALLNASNSQRPFYVYDPLLSSFTALADPSTADGGIAFSNASDVSCAAFGDFVYAHAGGMTDSTKLLKYNSGTNSWTLTAAVGGGITALSQLSMAASGSYVYVMGNNPDNSTALFLRYDPVGDAWTDLSSSMTGLIQPDGNNRGGLIADGLDSYLYYVRKNGSSATLHQYDIANGTWSELAAPGVSNDGNNQFPRIAFNGGRVYALLGNGATDMLSIYNPAQDSWTVEAVNVAYASELNGGSERYPRTILLAYAAPVTDPVSGARYFRKT